MSDEEPDDNDLTIDRELRRRTRRDFIVAGVAAAAGIGGWKWLTSRPTEDGIPWPLRRVLNMNERIAGAYFSPKRLSPTYDPSRITRPARLNGGIGLDQLLLFELAPEVGRNLGLQRIPVLANLPASSRTHDQRDGDVGGNDGGAVRRPAADSDGAAADVLVGTGLLACTRRAKRAPGLCTAGEFRKRRNCPSPPRRRERRDCTEKK